MTRGFSSSAVLIDEVRHFDDAALHRLKALYSMPPVYGPGSTFLDGLTFPTLPSVRLADVDFSGVRERMAAASAPLEDMVRRIVEAKASFAAFSWRVRRDRLVDEVLARYGVTLHPHPRLVHVVVVSRSDYEALIDGIEYDPARVPLMNGHLHFLGEAFTVWVMPDWTCDRVSVALARSIAVGLSAPRRAARVAAAGLTRVLSRGGVA